MVLGRNRGKETGGEFSRWGRVLNGGWGRGSSIVGNIGVKSGIWGVYGVEMGFGVKKGFWSEKGVLERKRGSGVKKGFWRDGRGGSGWEGLEGSIRAYITSFCVDSSMNCDFASLTTKHTRLTPRLPDITGVHYYIELLQITSLTPPTPKHIWRREGVQERAGRMDREWVGGVGGVSLWNGRYNIIFFTYFISS